MRKGILIGLFVYFFFLVEYFMFNLVGWWFSPNLLLLNIIYFNLAFGIRYSIGAAVLAGLLKDSFSTEPFGQNIFAFVLCAYMTTYLKRYLHYVASRRSRILLVFLVAVFHVAVQMLLHVMFGNVPAAQMFTLVFIPEIAATLIVTSYVFTWMKKCVLKLFA